MKSTRHIALTWALGLGLSLAADGSASTFKRVSIDGSFADWAGVPPAYEDPSETAEGTDFKTVYLAHDDQFLYVRFTLHAPGHPFTARNNLFIDSDGNAGTGFRPLGRGFGSELLIQSGAGYQEKNGGFNEGGINGLDWAAAPAGSATDFEVRISRQATFANDGLPVFSSETLAIMLEAENANFSPVDTAPDGGGIDYTFAPAPPQFTGIQSLLARTSTPWRFNDSGADLASAWLAPDYDDTQAGWSAGTGLFGYADNPAVYPAPIQSSMAAGHTTYYLRTRFQWDYDVAGVVLVASNYLSDGAVCYLNGVEARRIRLPAGDVVFDTPATGGPAVQGQVEVFGFPPGALLVGENIVQAEAHQNGDTSDLVFGLSLFATTGFPVLITDSAQPADRTVVAGQSTTFTVEVLGSAPITYRWFKDGAAIPGATNSTLTLSPVLATDAGAYQVRVSNPLAAEVASRSAILTVGGLPVRITDAALPADVNVVEGGPVTFTVVAEGSAPLSYQWFRNGQPLEGAIGPVLSLSRAVSADVGNYFAVVSNPVPSAATSRVARLTLVADQTPPVVERLAGSVNRIRVLFSEPVEQNSATATANYTASGSLTVVSAAWNTENPREVMLTTTPQAFGTRYCLTVNRVRDLFGNVIATSSTRAFVSTIAIDGAFEDWADVPLAYSDGENSPSATDFKDVYVTNDADYIYVRVTLHAPSDLGIFYNNFFFDADANRSTGYSFGVGSEMLVQGGAGYQEKNGGFNEGGIDGLDWLMGPSGVASEFEFRLSRHATYASDGLRVFTNNAIAFVFDAENTSFQTVDLLPDSGGLFTPLAEPPALTPGPLTLSLNEFGETTLSWPGTAMLQFRASLSGGDWQTILDGTGPLVISLDGARGFYRLLSPCE